MATAGMAQERLVEVAADDAVASDRRPVGEEKTFRRYDPDQVLLMAPVLQEWIPEVIWRTSSVTWSSPARLICPRSMAPMRRSVAIRRMTRG